MEQVDQDNDRQDSVELRCRACGDLPDLGSTIEKTLDDTYGGDVYIRAKEGGDGGPLFDCPAYNHTTLIEAELSCANCGEELDYETECIRCHNEIPIADFLDGVDGGLCAHMYSCF